MNEETKDKEEVYAILGLPVVIDPTLKTPQESIVFGSWPDYCEVVVKPKDSETPSPASPAAP